MNEKERLTLQNFHTNLVKDIIPNEMFLGEFIQQGILDLDLKAEILSEATDSAKSARFLSILPRRGPQAFPVLLQVLERTSPWIKEKLETFYNQQKSFQFNGDIDSLFDSAPETLSRNVVTSPKTLCPTFMDTAVQTESTEEEDKAKLNSSLGDIYLQIVPYLHTQGHKEFDIVVASVEPDLLENVVKKILNIVSIKENKLTRIMNLFNGSEKEQAGHDVLKLVENVLSEKMKLKEYLDNKDSEVMQLEKELNAKIKELDGQVRDLEESIKEEQDKTQNIEKQLFDKEAEIKRSEEAERQRQQEPLLKRMHNLIQEVTEAKTQKEKQMYATGQEYRDLIEETECIEDLLRQLKDVHNYHVTPQGRVGGRYTGQPQRTFYERQSRSVGNSGTYNRTQQSDGIPVLGIRSSTNENNQSSSSPVYRGPRRRLKRSPHPQNRVGQKNNSENVPMSPKQKTPRYHQPILSKQIITEMQIENRPATRKTTNMSRCGSRQGTDLSINFSSALSRQSTGYLSSRQNTVSSAGRPMSSRQSRISLDMPMSARNRHTNGTDMSSRNGQQPRTSFRYEESSPQPSARQTPCESPQLLFNVTPKMGGKGTGIMGNNFQLQSKMVQSNILHSVR